MVIKFLQQTGYQPVLDIDIGTVLDWAGIRMVLVTETNGEDGRHFEFWATLEDGESYMLHYMESSLINYMRDISVIVR